MIFKLFIFILGVIMISLGLCLDNSNGFISVSLMPIISILLRHLPGTKDWKYLYQCGHIKLFKAVFSTDDRLRLGLVEQN